MLMELLISTELGDGVDVGCRVSMHSDSGLNGVRFAFCIELRLFFRNV